MDGDAISMADLMRKSPT